MTAPLFLKCSLCKHKKDKREGDHKEYNSFMLDITIIDTMPTPAKRMCKDANSETEVAVEGTNENGSLSHHNNNNNNDEKTRKIIRSSLKSGKTRRILNT